MVLGPFATFFKIQLPNGLTSIFAGLKISITFAVVGAVFAESSAARAVSAIFYSSPSVT
jgi:ABC-type nitrate/sulfonate/bicarbonate transport system permease component